MMDDRIMLVILPLVTFTTILFVIVAFIKLTLTKRNNDLARKMHPRLSP